MRIPGADTKHGCAAIATKASGILRSGITFCGVFPRNSLQERKVFFGNGKGDIGGTTANILTISAVAGEWSDGFPADPVFYLAAEAAARLVNYHSAP